VLGGATGPVLDTVLLNAAAAVAAAAGVSGPPTEALDAALQRCRNVVEAGQAEALIKRANGAGGGH
jgi:anthranilate phosphoribosyltransferase